MRPKYAHAARFLAAVALVGWLAGPHASAPGGEAAPVAGAFPLRFEARGSAFEADALSGSIAVSEDTLSLRGSDGTESLRLALRGEMPAEFEGDQPSPSATREVAIDGPGTADREIASYRTLRAREVAPGVDAVISGTAGRVDLRLEIAGGAAASTVVLSASGAVTTDPAGRVRFGGSRGTWIAGVPLTTVSGDRSLAAPAVRLTATAADAMAIDLPAAEPGRSVVVAIPLWDASEATASVGSPLAGPRLTLDRDGNAYIAATAPPRGRGSLDREDGLVAKLDRTATDFVWVTYLSGAGDDAPRAIAIDGEGRIAVAGRSAAGGFVVLLDGATGALRSHARLSTHDDPRAASFAPTGELWIGGAAEGGRGFVQRLDAAGLVAARVETAEPVIALAIPRTGEPAAVTESASGGSVLMRLSADGKAFETIPLAMRAQSVAYDLNDRLVVVGTTGDDVVLAAIEPGETRPTELARLAGPGDDAAAGLAFDPSGRVFIAGRTEGGLTLPASAPRAARGGTDAFVASVDPDGRALLHGAYMGGTRDDAASAIAIDGNGRVWVAGETMSADTGRDESTWPLSGGRSGFVAAFFMGTNTADLSIVKVDTPDPVSASGALTYTLTVSNQGPDDATDLTVTDTLPASVAFVSATGTDWACGNVGQVVTCTRVTLAVGAAPDITISVTAGPNPGSITNNVSVTATSFDPTTPNTASAQTFVSAVADLTVTKTDGPDPVNSGANITYSVVVANLGPSAATSLSMTDILPPGVGFVSAIGTGWTCNHASGVVTCNRTSLSVTTAPAITITVTAPAAGGTITNRADVTAGQFDPTTPNTATATTDVVPVTDLSIAKTDSADPVNVGSPLTYNLAVTNLGPSPADDVTVTDTLPAGVTFVSATGTGWACGEAAGVVTCTLATLASGAAPVIAIAVTAPATGGPITNTATVATTTNDPVAGNDSDSEGTSVTTVSADLSIVKTDSADPVSAGATYSYTLTVANGGPDPASSATVTDTLPAGVTFVSATGTGWACGEAAGVVTCTLPGVNVGTAPAITITVTAPAEESVLSNTASVAAPEVDNDPADNSDTEGTTVNPLANLTITKTDSPDPVGAGGNLTYTISVSNAGPSLATGLTMTDTLPAGVGFIGATSTGWTCGQLAGVVNCTRAALAVGAAPDITIFVTAPAASGTITNTATVTATEPDPSTPNTASAQTTVTAVANLTITKTDAPDPVSAGQNLTYTVNVSNAGPSAASGLTVTDLLPTGSTFVSASGPGWACSLSGTTVTCTRPTLALGAAPPISIVITVPPAGGLITNTATATATEFDPTFPNVATAQTTVVPIADLTIAKSDTVDPVIVGSPFTYNVAVTNLGLSPAADVTVTDTLPAGVAFVSATGTGWSCGEAGGTVTCTRTTLAVGAAPVIAIAVTAPAGAGTITNSAAVATATNDPIAGNNLDTEGTIVTATNADLSLTKMDTPDPVNTGASLTYALTVLNAGPDPATDVTVVDTLPSGVSFISAGGTGWNCGEAGGVVTCTRPSLPVSTAPPISIAVTAPTAGGSIVNSATVAAAEADGNLGNNSASATTTVNVVANLAILKTDSPDPVLVGGTLTYSVAVANLSAPTAAGLTVTDTLPAGTTFVTASGSGWVCGHVSGVVTCTRPSQTTGTAPEITIVVTAPAAGGPITNTASVTSTSADPVLSNNTATAATTVTPIADLSMDKTDSADPVGAGDTFSYALAVSNAGPSSASTVSVTDTLPLGMTFVSAAGSGWSCSQASGTVTCTRATLAVGAAPAITITVRAPSAGGTVSNTALVTATTQDPDIPDRTDTETTTITPGIDLSITKSSAASTVGTGAPISWSLQVTNLGPSAATGVVVSDTLPAGVTFASLVVPGGWTCTTPSVGGTGIISCSQPTLPVGAPATFTLGATAPLVAGSVVNTATVEGAEPDPVAGNDSGQSTVNVTAGPACSSIEDLLDAVSNASMTFAVRRSLEAPLVSAQAAQRSGQPGLASNKLGLFQQHALAASSAGRILPSDAEDWIECADSLRGGAAAGATKGRAAPARPVRRP